MNKVTRQTLKVLIERIDKCMEDISNVKEDFESVRDELEEIKEEIETVKDDEESKYDNMPESLQESERGENMVEGMDILDSAVDSMEELIDESRSAILTIEEILANFDDPQGYLQEAIDI